MFCLVFDPTAVDMLHSDTGPELYKGAPVCVQVVGYRHADEALANAVAALKAIINGKGHRSCRLGSEG